MTQRTPQTARACRRPARGRLLALLLRPSTPPLGLGIAVAALLITVETLLVYQLREIAPQNAFGAVFLLGVLVVSAGWDLRLGVATSVASALVYVYFHMETSGVMLPLHVEDAMAILIFLPIALLANLLAGQARVRAAESEQRRREAHELALQQAALRRVATLVARGAGPEQVYPAAVTELANGLGRDHAALLRYEEDGASVVLATRDPVGAAKLAVGERLSLSGESVAALVRHTGEPARMDNYDGVSGTTAARVRQLGIRSAVGSPIVVDGRVRGALIVGAAGTALMPADTEAHVGDFADLVATAIANADTRAELTASRARIVTAADQARRRFERDLHDGAQQRVVSLGIELRAIEAALSADQPGIREQISRVVDGLGALSVELQEISRGIHPAVLSRGGLVPAIRALARRSAVPVVLELDVPGRLPDSVEVAAYYVTAETLTNAAKHAAASVVQVSAGVRDGALALSISDDGVGGAVRGDGSGLIGLTDRVEALAGQLTVSSPPGDGTTVTAVIPLR